jgi:hypothetical protein
MGSSYQHVLYTFFLMFGILNCLEVHAAAEYLGSGSITQGPAEISVPALFECQQGRARISAVGKIVDDKGGLWTVPAVNQYNNAPHAVNMYDDCSGVRPSGIAGVDTDSVPVVTVDADGDLVTGYIFADNYFELYINGQLIAVDAVPFTPFNSSIVKFRVKKPYVIAFKAIDWEEHLGLGTESGRGASYSPGDGGLIASFSDGTVTGSDWQAQTFYIAPVYDLSCLSEENGARLSTHCSTASTNSGAAAYGVHWPIPEGWHEDSFDSSRWPQATTYSEAEIGVNNKNGYMNFIELFTGAGASFIWSSNVVLDNEVLFRYRVE